MYKFYSILLHLISIYGSLYFYSKQQHIGKLLSTFIPSTRPAWYMFAYLSKSICLSVFTCLFVCVQVFFSLSVYQTKLLLAFFFHISFTPFLYYFRTFPLHFSILVCLSHTRLFEFVWNILMCTQVYTRIYIYIYSIYCITVRCMSYILYIMCIYIQYTVYTI